MSFDWEAAVFFAPLTAVRPADLVVVFPVLTVAAVFLGLPGPRLTGAAGLRAAWDFRLLGTFVPGFAVGFERVTGVAFLVPGFGADFRPGAVCVLSVEGDFRGRPGPRLAGAADGLDVDLGAFSAVAAGAAVLSGAFALAAGMVTSFVLVFVGSSLAACGKPPPEPAPKLTDDVPAALVGVTPVKPEPADAGKPASKTGSPGAEKKEDTQPPKDE